MHTTNAEDRVALTVSTMTSTKILIDLMDPKNDSAWKSFVGRYRPLVVRFARRYGLRADRAEDAAQETMMAFAGSFQKGNYDRERGRLRHWLFKIAHNHILKVLENLGRGERNVSPDTGSTDPLDKVPAPDNPEAVWEPEWRQAVLRACLEECRHFFDPKTLEAFELFARRGLPAREVARLLGISENAVFLAKHHVLNKIRELIPAVETDF